MFNLMQKWWDYKEEKLQILQEKKKVKEYQVAIKEKFGKYVKQAKALGRINKPESHELTKRFVEGIESGIESVDLPGYWATVKFVNGTAIKFWTENKMYAYAQNAVFKDAEGVKSSYEGYMPEKWCLFFIFDVIEEKNPLPYNPEDFKDFQI